MAQRKQGSKVSSTVGLARTLGVAGTHRRTMSASDSPEWDLAEGTIDGQRTILRLLAIAPSPAEQKENAYLIMVKWPFEPTPDGMPSSDEQDDMLAFEQAVADGSEQRRSGRLVLVITGANERQWRYYATDAEAFIQSVNQDLAGHPRYPLQIVYYQDPDWVGLHEYQALVQRDA